MREGAVVLGPAPTCSPSLADYPAADGRVQAMAAELWGPETGKHVNRYGKGTVFDGYSMEEVFDAIGLVPDFGHDASLPLLFGHRTTDGAEIYFVSNQSEEPIEFTASFRVADRRPEWWQPVTGAMRELPAYRAEGTVTGVPMRLEPLESGFVVFRKPTVKSAAEFTADANFPRPETVAVVDGTWQARFESPDGVGSFMLETDTLGDWSQSADERLRGFSGTATYSATFEKPAADGGRILLDLNRVGVMAKVRVNGAEAGGVWTPPYRVDVTDLLREGTNELEIEVVNTWVNRLVGDSRLPEAERRTWTAYNPYTPDSPLQESGLIGPVTLQRVAL